VHGKPSVGYPDDSPSLIKGLLLGGWDNLLYEAARIGLCAGMFARSPNPVRGTVVLSEIGERWEVANLALWKGLMRLNGP